ncbi:hypothetical protein CERZMDRAFT_89551 [Cercospora zeae-maydis SCOH1-5]|uniref:Uncharacterized protein n=1 Tax=Cercospora zeae-maydis SCOH1-5 TaxID=717836 RepID=A0A6A6FVU9_9PEZI|nr:hypothetical protein CERZMDRAFT_89551 [Cercospora zeae-maydis SCOH1-5]
MHARAFGEWDFWNGWNLRQDGITTCRPPDAGVVTRRGSTLLYFIPDPLRGRWLFS